MMPRSLRLPTATGLVIAATACSGQPGDPLTGAAGAASEAPEGGFTAAPRSEQPGTLVWRNVGRLVIDVEGTPYLVDTLHANLSRIDLATGEPLWTRRGDAGYLEAHTECGTASSMIGLSARGLVSLAPRTGLTLWETEKSFEGRVPDGFVALQCSRGLDYVVLQWHSPTEASAFVRRSDGDLLWSVRGTSAGQPVLATKDVVVLHRHTDAERSTLSARAAPDGRLLWSRAYAAPVWVHHAWGELYVVVGDQVLERINLHDGELSWSYRGNGVSPLFQADALLVRQSGGTDEVARLDRRSGAELWSHDLTGHEGENVIPSLMEDGQLYVTAQFLEPPGFTLDRIDPATGQLAWSIRRNDDIYFGVEMSAGALYLFGSDKAIRLHPPTGAVVWTSVVQGTFPDAPFGGRVDGIIAEATDALYVGYHGTGRFPRGGVVRLDVRTGTQTWSLSHDAPVGGAIEDAERFYVNPYPGNETLAFAK